ncbi:MAG: hypothetical protein GY827_10760 [Cytophagales bacterium]|nr:hypothetical protein [Cytophagales bacterium]
MKALELDEKGEDLSDMDYKFFFFPRYDDVTYQIDDPNVIINDETKKYFETLRNNDFIIRKYPGIRFSLEQMKWWQKKKEEQKDDMSREYPSFPKEAFDLAIK